MIIQTFLTAVCLGGTVLGVQTVAQDASSETASNENSLNLLFNGGTAAEYVEAVRQASPQANIVVFADLSKVSMPPLRVKSVNTETALSLLERLPQQQGPAVVKIELHRDGPLNSRQSETPLPVYSIMARIAEPKGSEARDSLVLEVGEALNDRVKAADLLTSIETSLAMLDGEFPPAQLKFHEATALLIARGHPEQMDCIMRVVQQLRDRSIRDRQVLQSSLDTLRESARLAEEEAESLRRELIVFRTRNEVLEQELQSAKRQQADLEQQMRKLGVELEAARQPTKPSP